MTELKPYPEYTDSGVEWLGQIPALWDTRTLRYLAVVETGSKDTVDADPDGAYPFIVRSPTPLRIGSFSYDTEAILTAGDGDVGEIFHHLDGKFDVHQRVYVLRQFRGVLGRFLYYYFSSKFINVVAYGGIQTTVSSLRRPMFTSFPVTVPSWDEQVTIADFLDRETAEIDAFIADQEELIGLLGERRAATIENVLSGAPERRPLRRVIAVAQTGPFGTQLSATEYVSGGTPVINPTHIHQGRVRTDSEVSVTPRKASELSRFAFRVGDIALGRKGEVDKSALIDHAHTGSICGSDSMLIRPDPWTNPSYLWWFLQSAGAHTQLELWSVGSTVAGLNQNTISQVRVPYGDSDFQADAVRDLDTRVAELDAAIADAREAIALSRERRAALVSAAVTGKIDVRGAA